MSARTLRAEDSEPGCWWQYVKVTHYGKCCNKTEKEQNKDRMLFMLSCSSLLRLKDCSTQKLLCCGINCKQQENCKSPHDMWVHHVTVHWLMHHYFHHFWLFLCTSLSHLKSTLIIALKAPAAFCTSPDSVQKLILAGVREHLRCQPCSEHNHTQKFQRSTHYLI